MSCKMQNHNLTQIQRYKNVVSYINDNFKHEINIEKIENVGYYSYRNINRIFQTIHDETIGKYIKRIRIEEAAKYIKYSQTQLSEIALEVGFSDLAAFSKAFKKRFNCSPSVFREKVHTHKTVNHEKSTKTGLVAVLDYEIEILPSFNMLFLEHRGDYNDINTVKKKWDVFLEFCERKKLITNKSIFFSEILDDNQISEHINCRYNMAMIIDEPKEIKLEGLYQTKTHQEHKYAKFTHQGPDENLIDTYNSIYSNWINGVELEFADLPVLEFYLNHHENIPPEKLLTEVYIPIQ